MHAGRLDGVRDHLEGSTDMRIRRWIRQAVAATIVAVVGAVQLSAQGAPATLTVTSPAFANGDAIPPQYTADGKNISPPLAWSGAPASTREFALILDDPDANFGGRGPFVHWVLYKIPGTAKGVPEAVPMGVNISTAGLNGAINGLSGFNAIQRAGQPPLEPGYRGPSPPAGSPHHYRFTVYALNAPLEGVPGLDKGALLKAMDGKIVAQGEIVGTYQR
jgi:Raf kinase inhibitor-like YbhB/YbcL family protein